MNKHKGQISLGILISLGALAATIVLGWVGQNNLTDVKINTLRTENQEKIDILKTSVANTNTNVYYICQSLKIKCLDPNK